MVSVQCPQQYLSQRYSSYLAVCLMLRDNVKSMITFRAQIVLSSFGEYIVFSVFSLSHLHVF